MQRRQRGHEELGVDELTRYLSFLSGYDAVSHVRRVCSALFTIADSWIQQMVEEVRNSRRAEPSRARIELTFSSLQMPRPHVNAPLAMVLAVIIGSVSSFIFLVCLLFSVSDVNQVISSSAGTLLAAMYQATGSVPGAICLQVFPLVAMFFTSQVSPRLRRCAWLPSLARLPRALRHVDG